MTQPLHLRPLEARTWARLASSDRIPTRAGRPVGSDDLHLALWLLGASVTTPRGRPPAGTWRLRATLGARWIDILGDTPTPPDGPVDLRFGSGDRTLLHDIATAITLVAGPQALSPANRERPLHLLWTDAPQTLPLLPQRWQLLCATQDLLGARTADVQHAHFTAAEGDRTLDVIIDRAPERAPSSFWTEAVFARLPRVTRPWPRIQLVDASAWSSAPLETLQQTLEPILRAFPGATALAEPFASAASSGLVMLQSWDLRAWLLEGERLRIALFWETSA